MAPFAQKQQMLTYAKKQLASALLLLAAIPCLAEQSPPDLDSGYSKLIAIERSTSLSEVDRLKAIVESYGEIFRKHLVGTNLRRIHDHELDLVLRSTYLVSFYTFNPTYLEDALLVMRELERRGTATDNHRKIYHRMLIGYRKFDEARNYSTAHPHLEAEAVPLIGELAGNAPGDPVVYRVDKEEHKLHPVHIRIRSNDTLLVITHPLCHFSRNAMAAIESDLALLNSISNLVVWMTPASMSLNYGEIQRWNQEHPQVEVVISRSHDDWPMVESWATPQFLLLRDGRVIDSFSGWPEGGSRDKLIQLLRRGGIFPSGAQETDQQVDAQT